MDERRSLFRLPVRWRFVCAQTAWSPKRTIDAFLPWVYPGPGSAPTREPCRLQGRGTLKEELARELAQHIINARKTEDRMIFPIGNTDELIIVAVVRTDHDPRKVNTRFLRLNGKPCPTCGGRGQV